MIYKFDHIELDTERFLLRVNGIEKSVEPQVFNLIVLLIENKDKVVTRDSILDNIWKGRVVSDTSINNHIKSARKVLGDDGTKQQVIKTIHSRGYQFVSITKIITDLQSNSNHYDQNKVEENAEITPQKSSQRVLFFLLPALFTLLLAVLFYFWEQNSRTEVEGAIYAKTNSSQDNSTQSQSTAQQTIAVLPFTDTSLSKDSGYLGFALANQIISDLSYLEKFSIRSASSVKHYVEQVIEPLIIGQKLHVDYVISGDYVLVNNDIKLNVLLIDVIKNQTIWQETIQVNYANTFGLQKMIAHKVAKGLHASFTENFIKHSNKSIPSNSLAYEYYLRGISYSHSNDGHKMAVEMLKKSIELDPNYAPAYAHLGFHRRLLEQHGRVTPTDLRTAQWYYKKALELNPELLTALGNLSALYTETNRIEEAVLISRKMLDINPNNAHSHFALGYIYRYAGMLDEAINAMEKALILSPENTAFRSIITTYLSAGMYQQALQKTYLDKGDYGTGYKGIIAFKQQQYKQASVYFRQVVAIDAEGIWGLISQLYLAVINEDKKQGLIILTKMVSTEIIDAENMYYFAGFYALLNEKESCLNMLKQAVNSGYFNYPQIVREYSSSLLQDDVRFHKILQQVKQRHEAFKSNFFDIPES